MQVLCTHCRIRLCVSLVEAQDFQVVKWSSRRDSNPHVAFTSRCTVGARVLRVSRSGTVQFTVQSHVVQNKSFESRQGQTSRVLARSIKSPLSNVALHAPTAISPTLPDRCTLWHSAFVAHGSIWFGSEALPIAFESGSSLPFSSTGRMF